MDQVLPRPRALAVVAEDEPLLRMEMTDLLAEEGFEVTEVKNAALALAAIERLGEVSVLFTDVRMPKKFDGADLAREVARRWPMTRIIVCSAWPPPEDLPEGTRFLDKPFLAAAVRKALG